MSTKRVLVAVVLVALVASGCTLRRTAARAGVFVGSAASPAYFSDATYTRLLGDEFSSITPENEMKWSLIHPAPDTYDFTAADAVVDFAEAHGMRVRGHTLAWYQQNPAWLTGTAWTRDEAIELLHDHIATVVGHYKGRVQQWDVVNEAFRAGTYQRNPWYDAIGPEYIDLAFQFAHEADPDAELFYNDYSIEWHSPKSDAVVAMVTSMVARGIPIDGVGMQMHVTGSGAQKWDAPDAAALAEQMARYEAVGLDVELTEMDVRLPTPATEEGLQAQAEAYRLAGETCVAAPNCTGITVWGFTDAHSWVPSTFAGWGAACLWDENYRTKPAYGALRQGLATGWPA